MERLRTALSQFLKFVRKVGRSFIADACPGRAAGLAFSTLFALVPLTAFVVAVLTTFGAFQPIIEGAEETVIEQLVPAVHEEVSQSISSFAANSRALGFFGFFIFIITAVLLLRNIHTSMNAIWQYRSRRGIWGTIASYTSIIVIGTTLISASFALGPIVQSIIANAFPDLEQARWLRSFLLPPLFLFVTFFSLNVLVPAGKVSAPSAALGAGVAVVIWELAKRVFVFWTSSVMRLSLIYGSLAVLPIFLIWIYVSWFVVLIGVEAAYVFYHRRDEHDVSEDAGPQPVSVLMELCLETALDVIRRHRDGDPALRDQDLDGRLGTDLADSVRAGLSRSGLILVTDHGLVPARSMSTLSLNELLTALIAGSEDAPVSAETVHDGIAIGHLLELWHSEPDVSVTSDRVLGAYNSQPR